MGAGAAAGPWQPHSALCPAGQGPQATAGAHGRREAARPPPSGGSLAGGHMWDALRCIWPFAFGFLSQISKCFARLIGFSRTALHALHVIFSVIFLVVFACAREQPRRTKGHERTRRQFGGQRRAAAAVQWQRRRRRRQRRRLLHHSMSQRRVRGVSSRAVASSSSSSSSGGSSCSSSSSGGGSSERRVRRTHLLVEHGLGLATEASLLAVVPPLTCRSRTGRDGPPGTAARNASKEGDC